MTALIGEARSAHILRYQNVAFYLSVERKKPVHDTDFFTVFVLNWGRAGEQINDPNRYVRVVRVVTDVIRPRRESVDGLTTEKFNGSQKFRFNMSSANSCFCGLFTSPMAVGRQEIWRRRNFDR